MEKPQSHPYCTRKYVNPIWHKPFKPILPKEERETPMLICRKPKTITSFDRKRMKELATPKKELSGVKKALRITWGDRETLLKCKLSKKPDLSDRLNRLALPKMSHLSEMDCGRRSPIWKVSKAAKNTVSSDRIEELAKAKQYHPNYIPDQPIRQKVSKSAKLAVMSARIEQLARANTRSNSHYFIDARRPEDSITTVKKSALKFEASERLQHLATAVGFPKDFEVPNLDFWKVKRAARNAKCSDRNNELAKHVTRQSMASQNASQNAFTVSDSAKKAQCSDRLNELAQPKKRK
jgi:hypothetical protein